MGKRIRYIDGLRGITILLVIYHHLICNALEFAPAEGQSIFNEICLTFRMPLFFCISGFFVYSRNYSLELFKRRSLNRITSQLYPSILIGFIFCALIRNMDFSSMLFDFYKGGYWFTYVAVEMFFFAAPLLYLFSNYKISSKWQIFILLSIGIAAKFTVLLATKYSIIKDPVFTLTNYFMFGEYLIFFFIGMIIKMYYEKIESIFTCKYLLAILISVFVFTFIFKTEINSLTIIMKTIGSIVALLSIIFVFKIIYTKTNFGKSNTSSFLEYGGG